MSDCIFCNLASGVFPCAKVYEDEICFAALDARPSALGHMLIVSKDHFANIYEMDEKTLAHMFTIAQKMAIKIKTALNCGGVNILQNNEQTAGQTVFHVHIHVIPRFEADNVEIHWKTCNPTQEEIKELLAKFE